MRELRAPFQPHRLDATDTHLLLRLDENGADTDNFVDATGGGAFTQTGSPRRSGIIYSLRLSTAPVGTGGSRQFSAADYGTRAGSGADRSRLQSAALTVEAWVYVVTLAGTSHTVICYGGNGATEALNYLLWFGFTTDGRLRFEWENGAGVLSSGESAAGVITQASRHHIGLTRLPSSSGVATECDVMMYVDGVRVFNQANVTLPTGGTDGTVSWRVGADMTAASRQANAIFDDIRVSKFSAQPTLFQDSYSRGQQDYDDAEVLACGYSTTVMRVLAQPDFGEWFDLTALGEMVMDFTVSARWTESADAQVDTATIILRHGPTQELSTSPFSGTEFLTGDPMIPLVATRIRIETATMPFGSTMDGVELSWRCKFDGFVRETEATEEQVTLTCGDLGVELQDTFIQPDRSGSPPTDFEYGSSGGIPVESTLQDFIDDQEPSAGWRAKEHTIYLPVASGWNVYNYNTPPTRSCAQQLEDVVGQRGWNIRRKWQDHRATHLLTMWEPDRAAVWASGDLEIGADQSIGGAENVTLSADDVRNKLDVEFGDNAVRDTTDTITRDVITVSDAASIAKYGERYGRIALGSTQRINNATDAGELAAAVLSDLKDPFANFKITIPYRFSVEVGDMVKLTYDANRLAHSGGNCAVVEVTNDISNNDATTTLMLRQSKPVGWSVRWFQTFIAEPGTVPADGLRGPLTPTGLAVTPMLHSVLITWDFPTNYQNRRYDMTEVHASSSSGFTPTLATLKALVRGNSVVLGDQNALGGTLYYKIVHRDRSHNRSPEPAQVSTVPLAGFTTYKCRIRQTGAGGTNYNTTPAAIESGLTATEEYDNGSILATSPWVITIPVDGSYSIAALAIVAAASTSCRVMIYVDSGSGYAEAAKGMLGTSESSVNATLELDAGDLVTLYITADATGRRLQSGTFFEARLVSL